MPRCRVTSVPTPINHCDSLVCFPRHYLLLLVCVCVWCSNSSALPLVVPMANSKRDVVFLRGARDNGKGKYYMIERVGTRVTISYGFLADDDATAAHGGTPSIATTRASCPEEFVSIADARREVSSVAARKIKQGYYRCSPPVAQASSTACSSESPAQQESGDGDGDGDSASTSASTRRRKRLRDDDDSCTTTTTSTTSSTSSSTSTSTTLSPPAKRARTTKVRCPRSLACRW
jgi:hypothetical protein